jgi:hypothetical protein
MTVSHWNLASLYEIENPTFFSGIHLLTNITEFSSASASGIGSLATYRRMLLFKTSVSSFMLKQAWVWRRTRREGKRQDMQTQWPQTLSDVSLRNPPYSVSYLMLEWRWDPKNSVKWSKQTLTHFIAPLSPQSDSKLGQRTPVFGLCFLMFPKAITTIVNWS